MRNKKNLYWYNKRVLITGHEGFLGAWLAKVLLGKGAKVTGIDKIKNRPVCMLRGLRKSIVSIKGDISDLKLVKRIMDKYKPQVVFHLAAESTVGPSYKDPIRAFKSNIEGSWNVLEASRGKKFIEAVIIASSDKAYGDSDKLPYIETTPLRASHPYDVSKSCADLITTAYFNTYNLPACIVRCGNIFGPGDFHFSRIVPDAIRSALKDRELLIRSDGSFTRDYIYVEDVVAGYILVAEKLKRIGLAGEAFNFGNERPLSVIRLIKSIYIIAGRKPCYKILNRAEHEIKHQYLSCKKAKRSLGWRPRHSLEAGLQITVDFYRKLFKRDD